jgi:hypothetical protein
MTSNILELNMDKTEVMWVTTSDLLKRLSTIIIALIECRTTCHIYLAGSCIRDDVPASWISTVVSAVSAAAD